MDVSTNSDPTGRRNRTDDPESAAGSRDHRRIVGSFEITGWDETVYEEPPEGPKLTRATVKKRFAGEIKGDSTAELLTAQGEQGRGYLASERFVGSILGRSGTVVFQHGGLADEESASTFGSVVPGSGTGELEGLAGSLTYSHDESGATVTLVLTA